MTRVAAREVPCRICATQVDLWRAYRLRLVQSEAEAFCGDPCWQRRDEAAPLGSERPAATPQASLGGVEAPFRLVAPYAAGLPSAVVFAILATVMAGLSLWLPLLRWSAALVCAFPAAQALQQWATLSQRPPRQSDGWRLWVGLGLVLPVLSAASAAYHEEVAWLVASTAALAVQCLRHWQDRRFLAPLRGLRRFLERHAQVFRSQPLQAARSYMAGERVVADGIVTAGHAQVRPRPWSTQALAVGPGAPLFAGMTLLSGRLAVGALDAETGPLLKRCSLLDLEDAPGSRWQLLPALLVAVLAVAALGIGSQELLMMLTAMTLLAPGVAPLRVAAFWRAAHLSLLSLGGVNVPDLSLLQRAGQVRSALMLHLSTLCRAGAELVSLQTFDGGDTDLLRADVTKLAAALPRHAYAEALGVREGGTSSSLNVEVLAQGLVGQVAGRELCLGTRALLLSRGVSVAAAEAGAADAERQGLSALFFARDGRLAGLLTFRRSLRPSARPMVGTLKRLGLELGLLSAEQRETCEALAREAELQGVRPELAGAAFAAEVSESEADGSLSAAVSAGVLRPGLTEAAVPIIVGPRRLAQGFRGVVVLPGDLRGVASVLGAARDVRESWQHLSRIAPVVWGLSFCGMLLGLRAPLWTALICLALESYAWRYLWRSLRRTEASTTPY